MTSHPRVQPGVPTGGQFAARQHAESDVELTSDDAPAVTEYIRDGHDEVTSLSLAIERVRQRHNAITNARWAADRYEDPSHLNDLSEMSCAPENATENAAQAGEDIDDAKTMRSYILSGLDSNHYRDEVLDELDRIAGAPPQRRALRAAEAELPYLRETLADAEAEVAVALADETYTANDRAYYQREADSVRQKLHYAEADVELHRALDEPTAQPTSLDHSEAPHS